MSDANKQLLRQKWQALTDHNPEKLRDIYAENAVFHGSGGQEHTGRQPTIDLAQAHLSAFPDTRAEVEHVVAEGDFVAASVRLFGTNTGEAMGLPATGRSIDLRWVMNMVRIQDGKIVEEWEIFDQADFMSQLGLA